MGRREAKEERTDPRSKRKGLEVGKKFVKGLDGVEKSEQEMESEGMRKGGYRMRLLVSFQCSSRPLLLLGHLGETSCTSGGRGVAVDGHVLGSEGVVDPVLVGVLRVRARVVGVVGIGSGSVVSVLGVGVGSGRVG